MRTVIVSGVTAVVGFAYYCAPNEVKTIEKIVEVPVTVTEYVEVEVPKFYPYPILVTPNVYYPPSIDYDNVMMDGVKFFEGFKSKRYKCCAGVPTIGYGCTDKSIVSKGSISESYAANLLEQELLSVKAKVKAAVKVDLTDNQLNALTSFTYNCGMTNLKKLIGGPTRLNAGNYKSVEQIMPMYRMAAGEVREGLVKRRKFEVALWKGEVTTF
tara:strand:- start:244 stop:882 length:639 start_codon:yes stop_codon:yes gene_type:complete